MAIAINLPDDLVEAAKHYAAAESRSAPQQIEYWARIGKAVTDNPDMPLRVIQEVTLSQEEVNTGMAAPYKFD
jgi:hypothetical protein